MHGLAVSGGIAIGHAHLVTLASLEVDHYSIPAEFVIKEIKRFDRAVKSVRAELDELEIELKAAHKLDAHSGDIAAFVTIHRMLLDDPTISVEPRAIIERERCNAEWALKLRVDELLSQFADVQDEYLRERRTDVRQVAERVVAPYRARVARFPRSYVVAPKTRFWSQETCRQPT